MQGERNSIVSNPSRGGRGTRGFPREPHCSVVQLTYLLRKMEAYQFSRSNNNSACRPLHPRLAGGHLAGFRYLQNVEEDKATRSAYGDHWDVLWLGHCAAFQNHTDKQRFVITNDPTVEPVQSRQYWLENPDMSTWDHPSNNVNDTRIVFRSLGGGKPCPGLGSCCTLLEVS